jgi:hypothetical protein
MVDPLTHTDEGYVAECLKHVVYTICAINHRSSAGVGRLGGDSLVKTSL